MKKVIIILFIITVVSVLTNKVNNEVLIPDDAIRFRIIANNNSIKAQENKIKIKEELEPLIKKLTNNNKDETKRLIKENMGSIEKIINKYTNDYNINYGYNYFPEKKYKGVTYKEGNYESLVITLGNGLGNNWWCVLFPPLCLLEAKEEEYDEYTYSLYIKDILDKY